MAEPAGEGDPPGGQQRSHEFYLLRAAPRLKELTGATDLISHYGLAQQYDTLCNHPLPASAAESSYLQRVVGSIDIRRGEGMELGQLLERPSFGSSEPSQIAPLSLKTLEAAFSFWDGPAVLPESEKGAPTISGGAAEPPEGEKKKKHKDRHKDKGKERRKDKDKDKDKEKRKDKPEQAENGEEKSRKHKKKKRKRDGEEEKEKEGEDRKHKKKKSKHSDKAGDKGGPLANGT